MTQAEILKDLLDKATADINNKKQIQYSDVIILNVDVIVALIDNNKSLVSALITSLLKKITDPKQDIRLHRTDMEGGYSARTLDTKITAPFFKQYFPKYANKESAFLSIATRSQIPWTKKDGGKIRTRASKQFMSSFLEILDAVENEKIAAKDTLIYFFTKLHVLSLQQKILFDETIKTSNFISIVDINIILQMLEKHFLMNKQGVSRLPVIAIYSIYQQLFNQIKRYENKILRPLNVHTASDKHGYGDIEIWDKNGKPFEMIEVKHNIPIDRNLIFDVAKKSENTDVKRYYVLTTAKDNFVSQDEEKFIHKFILKIKEDTGLEVIANGIFSSLKYYLRFIEDYREFIRIYTNNLIEDSKKSTEIKDSHITEWKRILEERNLLIT